MAIQQKQTLKFFDSFAKEWKQNAQSENGITQQRNNCVLRAIQKYGLRQLLDVGCGTGELVRDAATLGCKSHGIDFAPDMIEQARAYQSELASFSQDNIFEFKQPTGSYDIISALGVIEYISFDELQILLDKALYLLKPNGLLCLGSRNRLFNIFSANDYSRLEISLGTVDRLLKENIEISNANSLEDVDRVSKNFDVMLPQPSTHPDTGIAVQARYQYTPFELINLLKNHSFKLVGLSHANAHLVSVPFSKSNDDEYSGYMNYCAMHHFDDWRLLPNSSTFVITAAKEAS